MEQNPSSEANKANNNSASHEIPAFYGIVKFVTIREDVKGNLNQKKKSTISQFE
jgi:hypothetical protein